MAEMNDIAKLAVDGYTGKVEKYSTAESQKVLREALIEANNGKTTLDYRDIRDGKCVGLFSIVEQLLGVTVEEGLRNDDYFNALVDYRNVEDGDENMFVVEDSNLFAVSKIADGIQGIRRQRLGGATEVPIPTERRGVRIYEELRRVLAGRVDFNDMINRVGESFRQQMLNDIYALWGNAVANQIGGTTFFTAAGSYSESALLDLIANVEAAAGGKTATIIGTKKNLRNLAPSVQGETSKTDLYTLGYYGHFYGNPVVALPQRFKVGTTTFAFPDNMLTIIAGDDKPIKVVREGDPLMILRNPEDNNDLTQEYFYSELYGMGIVLAGKNAGVGIYKT